MDGEFLKGNKYTVTSQTTPVVNDYEMGNIKDQNFTIRNGFSVLQDPSKSESYGDLRHVSTIES